MSTALKVTGAVAGILVGIVAAAIASYNVGHDAGVADKYDRIGALSEDLERKNEQIDDLKLHCPPPSVQALPTSGNGEDAEASTSEVPVPGPASAPAPAAYEIDLSLEQSVNVPDAFSVTLTDVIRRGSELEAVVALRIRGSEHELSLQQGGSGKAGAWTVQATAVTPSQATLLVTEGS